MRILFLLHQFFPEFQGGTERVTVNLAHMAQRAGHHVHVLACKVKPSAAPVRHHPCVKGAHEQVTEGVPVTLLERRRLPADADHAFDVDPLVRDELEVWLRRQAFDVVHALHGMRMASTLAAVQRCGLPLVWTLTDFYLPCHRVNLIDASGRPCDGPQEGRACEQRCSSGEWREKDLVNRHAQAEALLRYARVCVAPSSFVADRIMHAFPALDLALIPHGVDLLAIAHARPARSRRPEPTLGFVGSVQPIKGLHVLLAALAMNPHWSVRLRVAGAFHGKEAYEAEIRAAAAADSRVELLGALPVQEVHQLLLGLDLLCLPSLVPESYSLALHEAAAAGVPALVANRGAPADFIRLQGGGAVVDDDDPQSWAEALRGWLGEPETRQAWQRAVRLPMRMEEEAFFYETLYRQAVAQNSDT